MGKKARELCEKIKSIYPEIGHCGIEVNLKFDKNKNAWVVKLDKEETHLSTHLETEDADECMEGKECVHLGVQIYQFIKNIEKAKNVERV